MNRYYFDLETEGLPLDQIAKLIPEFEAGGNIKDPEKIKAAIESKRTEWLDKTALKAITGKIVAFASAADERAPEFYAQADEKTLIEILVTELRQMIQLNATAYAWNGHGFDLPFLCQRAAVHDIPAFKFLTTKFRGRYYWHENLVDAKAVWSNNSLDHSGSSLNSVSIALGIGEKTGNGKDFAALLKSDPVKAKEYALMDVELLRKVVLKMGI